MNARANRLSLWRWIVDLLSESWMFSSLVNRASGLIERLEVVKAAYDAGQLRELPSSKQVPAGELDGWFGASEAVISQAFGEDSPQIRKWKDRREWLRQIDDRDAQKGTFHPIQSHIDNIRDLRGLLLEFDDIWQARERSHSSGEAKMDSPKPAKEKTQEKELPTQPPAPPDRRTQIALALITAFTTILVAYWQFGRTPEEAAKKDQEKPMFSGRVSDGTTGQRIRGAKVSLEARGIPLIAHTDSEGIFSFPLDDVEGRVLVVIEAGGYQPYDRRVDTSAASGIEDIRLSPVKAGPEVAGAIAKEEDVVEFLATNESGPFAIKGRFSGRALVRDTEIVVQVEEASLSFPELAPDGGGKHVEYLRAGLACKASESWDELARSNTLKIDKSFNVGERDEIDPFELRIRRPAAREIAGCWLVFDIAVKNEPEDVDFGFSHAHSSEDLF